jgi:predicted nucleotidyltransferase/DNA-binding transcriptional ArsR family regulator
MIEKYSRYRILQEFFDFPRKNFQMREISRNTRISQPSVINHLKVLILENLIIKEKKGIYPTYKANRENELFKTYKKMDFILRIHKIGLVNYINDSCLPNAIILFGSTSKGEDIEESDIDLFIQSPEKKLKLEKYEKSLNRKISLFFEENFSKLNNELKNNILNGMVIKGYLKIF